MMPPSSMLGAARLTLHLAVPGAAVGKTQTSGSPTAPGPAAVLPATFRAGMVPAERSSRLGTVSGGGMDWRAGRLPSYQLSGRRRKGRPYITLRPCADLGQAPDSEPLPRQQEHALQDSEGRLLLMAHKPSPLLTAQEAVVAQLEALKMVYHPNGDLQLPQHGLEVVYNFAAIHWLSDSLRQGNPLCLQVVYNFAAIDPFNKGSTYFGKRLNVAYFSQFSAKFSLREFRPLLGMHSYDLISSLHISPVRFSARVGVRASPGDSPAVFLFNLIKSESGHLRGCWVTESLQRAEEEG